MKDLFAGRREGTLLQVIILGAVLILAVVVIGVAIISWHTASVAKHTAAVAKRTAAVTQARYWASQTQVHHLCVQREGIEVHLRQVEAKDVSLQQALVKVEIANPFIDDKVRKARISAYTVKMNADLAYLLTPIEDGCEKLLP